MKGKHLTKWIGGLAIVVILVLAVFYYLNQRPDNSIYAKAGTTNSEAQQILAKDLERNYPANVREVVRLYARISKCWYTEKITEEELAQLILKQRSLFCEELLENNPLISFSDDLKSEVEAAKEAKRSMVLYRVQKESSAKKWTADGVNYASIIACFMMKEAKGDYEYTYEEFLLREENSRWKIVGWRLTDPVEIDE